MYNATQSSQVSHDPLSGKKQKKTLCFLPFKWICTSKHWLNNADPSVLLCSPSTIQLRTCPSKQEPACTSQPHAYLLKKCFPSWASYWLSIFMQENGVSEWNNNENLNFLKDNIDGNKQESEQTPDKRWKNSLFVPDLRVRLLLLFKFLFWLPGIYGWIRRVWNSFLLAFKSLNDVLAMWCLPLNLLSGRQDEIRSFKSWKNNPLFHELKSKTTMQPSPMFSLTRFPRK